MLSGDATAKGRALDAGGALPAPPHPVSGVTKFSQTLSRSEWLKDISIFASGRHFPKQLPTGRRDGKGAAPRRKEEGRVDADATTRSA